MNRREYPRQRNAAVIVAITLFLLPVLYVLSIGPAVAFYDRTGVGGDFFTLFYFPLEWLRDNTPLREPLDWYVDLWE